MRDSLPPEIRAHRNHISLAWRICFLIYALALTIGTHWPRLEFGPEIPATDKSIHLLAFGGATVLLRLTRWITNTWLCGLVILCWSIIDEYSQNLPGLHRSSHWHDLVANGLGVTVACGWLWALGPVGARFSEGEVKDGPNRMRLRALAYSFDETFAKPGPWIAGVIAAISGGLALLACWFFLPVAGKRIAILGAVTIALLSAVHFWWRQWRAELKGAELRKPCTNCASTAESIDNRCPRCGRPKPPSLWILPRAPARAMAFRLTIRPTMVAFSVLVLGFALILLTPWLYSLLLQGSQTSSSSVMAMRLAQAIGRLPDELVRVIDLSLYLLLFAAAMRIYRTRLAKFYDRAVVCARCGHDLRGTPTEHGIGRCGECGAAFARANA